MKHNIEVRIKRDFRRPGWLLGVIQRKLRFECVGNFNPAFCTYHGKRYLVSSMEGDISDPFRREESYLKTLYIEI